MMLYIVRVRNTKNNLLTICQSPFYKNKSHSFNVIQTGDCVEKRIFFYLQLNKKKRFS